MAKKAAKPKYAAAVEGEAATIGRICEQARDVVMARVKRHMDRHPDSPWNGAPLVDLEKVLDGVYDEWGEGVKGAFREAIPSVIEKAREEAAEAMKTAGVRNAILGKPDMRRVKMAVESSYDRVAGRTDKMKADHIAALRRLSAEVFRTASLTGETRKEISKRLQAKATEVPGFKFVDKSGRQWSDKAYFEMLARTELMTDGRDSYADKCAEEGYDIVRLNIGGKCCEACARWEGKLFSLTGATKGLPTMDDLRNDGVFHPNCTHSFTAVPDWELDELGLKQPGKDGEDAQEGKDAPEDAEAVDKPSEGNGDASDSDEWNRQYERKRDEWAREIVDSAPVKGRQVSDLAEAFKERYTPDAARLGDPPKVVFDRDGTTGYSEDGKEFVVAGDVTGADSETLIDKYARSMWRPGSSVLPESELKKMDVGDAVRHSSATKVVQEEMVRCSSMDRPLERIENKYRHGRSIKEDVPYMRHLESELASVGKDILAKLELPTGDRVKIDMYRAYRGISAEDRDAVMEAVRKLSSIAKNTDGMTRLFEVQRMPSGRPPEEAAAHSGGTVYIRSGVRAPVVAHELAHMLEMHDRHVVEREVEFLNHRNGSRPERRLNTCYGYEGIANDDIMVKKDNFKKAYAGRLYYNSDGSVRATDCLSTGVEQLIDNPARFLADDPEYFAFTVAMLKGEI